MRKRRCKKAFRKLIDHKPVSHREVHAGVRYSVREYGIAGGAMMAATIRGMNARREETANAVSLAFNDWIDSKRRLDLNDATISAWIPDNLQDN